MNIPGQHPNDVLYVTTFYGQHYIGKYSPRNTDDALLILDDALQLTIVPIPTPSPQGVAMRMSPTFIPIDLLAGAPICFPLPEDMIMNIQSPALSHPLAQQYVKQTSRIELATGSMRG